MAIFFQRKLELFGENKLVKKITLEDMDEDDMAAVKSGSVHFLSQKDRAGRPVFFSAQKYDNYKRWENQVSGIGYMLKAARSKDSKLTKSDTGVPPLFECFSFYYYYRPAIVGTKLCPP
jgi:hypothetical protein